jgi:hypothetical protein
MYLSDIDKLKDKNKELRLKIKAYNVVMQNVISNLRRADESDRTCDPLFNALLLEDALNRR